MPFPNPAKFLSLDDLAIDFRDGLIQELEEESAPEDALAQRASLRSARWWRMWQWMRDMPSVTPALDGLRNPPGDESTRPVIVMGALLCSCSAVSFLISQLTNLL